MMDWKMEIQQDLDELKEQIKYLQIEQNILKIEQEHLGIRIDMLREQMRSLNGE